MKKKFKKNSKTFKTIRWQHEDTGRIVDMPAGKNPGHRWYKIPSRGNKK